MIKSLFFCAAVISSVNHADFLARLTRFSLIGACLWRTDKNSAFHVEKFMFEHGTMEIYQVDLTANTSHVLDDYKYLKLFNRN